MTTPVQASQLNPPEPPGGPGTEYPITDLTPTNITDYVNQAGFTAKTGNPPPAYNPILPVKTWVDTDPPKGVDPVIYHTIHLDPSFQHAVETDIAVPVSLAGITNIPPDTGPIPTSTAGTYLVPKRTLASDEQFVLAEGGIISVQKIVPPTPPPSTGGFNQHDRMMLTAIYNKNH